MADHPWADSNFSLEESSGLVNRGPFAESPTSAWHFPRDTPLPPPLDERGGLPTSPKLLTQTCLDQAFWDGELRPRRHDLPHETYDALRVACQTVAQTQGPEVRPMELAGVEEYDLPPNLNVETLGHRSVDEKSFLAWYPRGGGTITYTATDGQVACAQDLDVEAIGSKAPLLAAAFEETRSGPRLHLEAVTSLTIWPFLRFLYTDSYALSTPNGDYFRDVPTSLLLHCQLYRLGDIYDLPQLKSQAYVNVLRQCEFGCSSPDKPIDLWEGIRYVYEHLASQDKVIDAIVNYCVTCFKSHRLGSDPTLKEMAHSLRPFHQALCRVSMAREYQDDTAAAIIRLPLPTSALEENHPLPRRFVVPPTSNDREAGLNRRIQIRSTAEKPVSALTVAIRSRHPEATEPIGEQLTPLNGSPRKKKARRVLPVDATAGGSESKDEYVLVSMSAGEEALDSYIDGDNDGARVGDASPAGTDTTMSCDSDSDDQKAGAGSESEWSII